MRDEHHANRGYGLKELNTALPRLTAAFPAPLPGLPAEFLDHGQFSPSAVPVPHGHSADLRNLHIRKS
jgi:hypothetical protein